MNKMFLSYATAVDVDTIPPAEAAVHRRIGCLGRETRILTTDGVRPIADLVGETPDLLTSGGVWAKALVETRGCQRLLEVTVSRNKVTKVLYASPEHGWRLRTSTANGNPLGRRRPKCSTGELLPGDRLAFVYPQREVELDVHVGGVARGFVFGDGSSTPHSAMANFCGSKDKELLGFFGGWREPRSYGDVLRVTGLPRRWKTEYPELNGDKSYLYGWLAGYFAADGDVGKSGRPTITSAQREHLEFVKLLCTRIGVGTFGIRERYGGSFGGPDSRLYLMGLMRGDLDEEFFLIVAHKRRFTGGRNAWERRGWTVRSVVDRGLIDDGFCAVLEGHESFALEDNILTGDA